MEQELLQIIEEVLILETENIEIEEKLQRFAADIADIADISNYQEKASNDSPLTDDRLIGVAISNTALIVAGCYNFKSIPTWETRDFTGAIISVVSDIIFSSCLLYSYFKEKKGKNSQEGIDYSKISELQAEIQKLKSTYSKNSDRIQELNSKMLEFKEVIADLCVQKMVANDNTYVSISVEKKMAIGEERR